MGDARSYADRKLQRRRRFVPVVEEGISFDFDAFRPPADTCGRRRLRF